MCSQSSLNGSVDFLLAGHVDPGDNMAVVVGHDLLNHVAGEDFLPVDDAGNLQYFGRLTLEFGLKVGSLLASGQVAEDGFVDGGRWFGDAVHHDASS